MGSPDDVLGLVPDSFQTQKLLGVGGTAKVYEVLEKDSGHLYALKVPLSTDSESITEFNRLADREYELIGGYRFPGLVRLLERPPGKDSGILLELCSGPTLDQLSLTISESLEIIMAIAANLEFLHAANICHGDLKPQNIFLPEDWKDSIKSSRLFYAKLSDFSLGKMSSEENDARVGLGTIGYAAPETLQDNILTHRSDLFSLGVIAYFLLTGKHPYLDEDTDPVRVKSRTCEETPPPPSTLKDSIGKEIDSLVMTLLSIDPVNRLASALEVCERLRLMGSSYPYEVILNPRWLFRKNEGYDSIAEPVLDIDQKSEDRLIELTNKNPVLLRLILTISFRRGELKYSEGKFSFKSDIYWPYRCRLKLLSEFTHLSLSKRKLLIENAVRNGGSQILIREANNTESDYHSLLLNKYLLSLLSQSTIIRISRRLVSAVEDSEPALAAVLHLQSGTLSEAERCAQEAAYTLQAGHRTEEAMTLLRQVIRYAETTGKQFEVRRLWKTYGDFQKETGDTEGSLETFRSLIDLYQSHEPDKLLAETYKDLGDAYRISQDLTKALKSLESALRIYVKLKDEIAISNVYNNIGTAYWLTADMKKGLENYRKALRIQRRLKADSSVASTLNNIGNVYGVLGRYTRCIRILSLSLELKRELGDAKEIARTLNNLGYALHLTGHSVRAADCLKESLEINIKIGAKKEILFNVENLGTFLIKAGQLDEAEERLAYGLNLAEEIDDNYHTSILSNCMATLARRRGDFARTLYNLERSERISKELDNQMLTNALRLQRAIYRYELGDYRQAELLSKELLSIVGQSADQDAHLGVLLLLARIVSVGEYDKQLGMIIDEQHLKNEKQIRNINRLEYALNNNDDKLATNIARHLMGTVTIDAEDIETARACNLIAETFLNQQDYDSARDYLSRAEHYAKLAMMLPDLAHTVTLKGRLYFSLQEWESSFKEFKKGLRLFQSISDTLLSEDDKKHFQKTRMVICLKEGITRLRVYLNR